jgi:acetyl esterase
MTTAPRLDPGLDPGLAALLDAIAAAGLPRIGAGTAVEARAGFRAMTYEIRSPELVVPVGSVTEGTLPGPDGPLAYRVYRPADVTGPVPTVLFIHGGGFVIGDIDTHDNQARRVCRDTGAVVVSVDYRLAPEAAFPAPVEDCWAALRWVADHAGELGGDAARLAVCGDSAGGNLAAVVARRARDAGGPALVAQLLLYPTVDAAAEVADYPSRLSCAEGYLLWLEDMIWFDEQYTSGFTGDRADPDLSPLHAPSLEGLAPAVITVAEFDPLHDEGVAYARALEAAGVPVTLLDLPGMIHGYFEFWPAGAGVEAAVAATTTSFREALRDG